MFDQFFFMINEFRSKKAQFPILLHILPFINEMCTPGISRYFMTHSDDSCRFPNTDDAKIQRLGYVYMEFFCGFFFGIRIISLTEELQIDLLYGRHSYYNYYCIS